MNTLNRERLVIIILGILVAIGLIIAAYEGVRNGVQPSLIVSAVIFGTASVIHAIYMLGWYRAIVFFLVSAILSFVAETFSIATCLATCYTYTDVLGPKLGLVPIVIPVSWFIMIYAGYVVVNLITEGFPISTRGRNLWIIGLSITTSLVMTAWDLTLDPYMVNKEQAWLWQDGGAYFGIPFANYVSWVETTFIIVIIYRLWEREIPLHTMGKITPTFAAIPVMIYALMGLPDMFVGFPEATKVISPFAMGIPILAATARVLQMPKSTPPSAIPTDMPTTVQPSHGSA
jgi:uncharacterized membrane protein